MNALFDQELITRGDPHLFTAEEDLEAYVPLTFTPFRFAEREEYGRKVSITVIDTLDFGESLNNEQG